MEDYPGLLPPEFDELSEHLQKLKDDPTLPLDKKLLETCSLLLEPGPRPTVSARISSPDLFSQAGDLLPKLQQNPEPLIDLVDKLATHFKFDYVKDVNFCLGLALQAKPYHQLMLSLLEKACHTAIDAEKVANQPDVVEAIVRLWLCTDDVGIASRAGDLLVSLLTVSRNVPDGVVEEVSSEYGWGPIWKRLFEDRDIYYLFYLFCTLKPLPPGKETPLGKRDISLAQARLLEWIPKVGALDWSTIASSQHPDVERLVGLNDSQGLLHYAAMQMVDTDADLLMHMSLINFYSDLISTVSSVYPGVENSSVSLEFLKRHGIHEKTIRFHTAEEQGVEHSFLSSRTANYIAEYASNYPENFEKSAEAKVICQQLDRNIRKCHPDDLHILASLPRTSLVPFRSNGYSWDECTILSLPLKRTTADALKALAAVLHGPSKEEAIFPSRPATEIQLSVSRHAEEAAYARLLLCLLLTRKSDFFTNLIQHAETIAMKDNALAALVVLRALITANWSTSIPERLSPEDPLIIRAQKFPKTGLDLILDPTISGGVLAYLLKPATTFSGLIGGRGDVESAAYQVARAKFDVLTVLKDRAQQSNARQDIVSMLQRRLREGPWGSGGNTGSRIGTLEL